MRTDAEDLDKIRQLFGIGKLKIPAKKTYPISQVRETHEAKDKRVIFDKIV